MAVARTAPKCPKCGESYGGIYRDQSNVPIMHRLIGDTFIRWDISGHICRLGIRYFIERIDTQQWYMKRGWTNDPMKAKVFTVKDVAEEFLKMSTDIPSRLECQVTEHEFVPIKKEPDKKLP